MEWLWTWKGRSFGYKDGDNLWTYNGYHVGKFHDEEVYDKNGNYLGELINGNRLIRNKSKRSWRKYSFTPYSKRGAYANYANYAGYEDFPEF